MTIYGRVSDPVKKSAVQGATVAAGDVSANTDDLGRFTLSSPEIVLSSIVNISHPNYHSKSFAVTGASDLGFIELIEKPAVLDVETDATEKSNNNWLWILLVLGGLYIWSNKQRN